MGYGTYLTRSRHQTTWYARIAIPRDLRERFKRQREIRKTLGTSCKATAKRRAMAVWLAYQEAFDAIRNGQPVKDLKPEWGALAAISAAIQPQEAAKPRNAGRNLTITAIQPLRARRKSDGETFHVYYADFDWVTGKSTFDNPTEAELEGVERMARTWHKLQRQQTTTPAPAPEPPQRTFTEAADAYIERYRRSREYDGSFRESSFDKEQRDVAFWKYYFEGVQLHAIDIEICSQAEQDCRNYPKNIDAIKAAQLCREDHGLNTTGVQATKTRLKVLQRIFAHALKYRWIQSDPSGVIDTKQRRGSSDTDKEPFITEELQLIFPGDNYGIDFFPRPASRERQYDAAKFWIPLIAAFTGARLGEIIQLELNDIKQDASGTRYFHITTESDDEDSGKELKTASSRRRVPIHSQLIEIGLLDYIKERQRHPSKPTGLFDHYCRSRPNGAKITAWFKGGPNGKDRNGKPRFRSGYLDRRGLKTSPKQRGTQTSISFHSFRHTFTDAARRQQFPNGDWIRDDDTQWLLGHGKVQTTGKYGHGQDIEFLAIIVEAVTYEGVDFASIKWSEFKKRWNVQAVNS